MQIASENHGSEWIMDSEKIYRRNEDHDQHFCLISFSARSNPQSDMIDIVRLFKLFKP